MTAGPIERNSNECNIGSGDILIFGAGGRITAWAQMSPATAKHPAAAAGRIIRRPDGSRNGILCFLLKFFRRFRRQNVRLLLVALIRKGWSNRQKVTGRLFYSEITAWLAQAGSLCCIHGSPDHSHGFAARNNFYRIALQWA